MGEAQRSQWDRELRHHLTFYEHHREAAARVAELLDRAVARQTRLGAGESIEVELRLGRIVEEDGKRHFEADVGDAFSAVLGMLESYQGWLSVSDWEESEDVLFRAPANGGWVDVRSRIEYQGGSLSVCNVRKERIGSIDLSAQVIEDGGDAEVREAPLHMRVSAAVEQEIPRDALPPAVQPLGSRLRRRKSFSLGSVGAAGAIFRFDCTRIWDGPTRRETEEKRASGADCQRSVEIECVGMREYLAACQGDTSLLALSLLLKAMDFVAALAPTSALALRPHT